MPKASILVVEDEGIVAEDIQMSLEDFGYEVPCVVSSGEEAVLKAGEFRPDLILMDVVLQGEMDGIETARRIQAGMGIPVVYLTAYADDEMLKRAKITEPFGYLVKPFRDQDLHSTIEIALYRHQLYAKMKEGREWLAVTLNSIGDAVIATDRQGLVKFMNPVARQLTGWSECEAKGTPLGAVFKTASELGSLLPTDSLAFVMAEGETANLGEQDLVLFSRDGTQRAIEANVSPIREESGAYIGMVLVFRDITERRNSEDRLRLLSEAVRQSSEGIALVDLSGRVTCLNKAFAEMHGYTPEEVIGKDLSIFHTLEQMPALGQAIRQIGATGEFSGEIWHARVDGSVFPGLMHNSLWRDRNGKRVGMICTLQDITDIKATQRALRASNEALEAYSSSLEAKVKERTQELETSRLELKKYSESLEKSNEALKIIIEGIEQQKREIEKKITHNLNLAVKPIIGQLQSQEMSDTTRFLLQSLEFNLSNVFSSFGTNMATNSDVLTPKEIRICEMIRSGLSSKQIAKVMGISAQTVLVHRKNIRKKLTLSKSRRNLASYLRADRP